MLYCIHVNKFSRVTDNSHHFLAFTQKSSVIICVIWEERWKDSGNCPRAACRENRTEKSSQDRVESERPKTFHKIIHAKCSNHTYISSKTTFTLAWRKCRNEQSWIGNKIKWITFHKDKQASVEGGKGGLGLLFASFIMLSLLKNKQRRSREVGMAGLCFYLLSYLTVYYKLLMSTVVLSNLGFFPETTF